ncbi:MAG: ABC transporter substrate-binding protein [Aggregatilineales bacterium]
MFKRSLLIMVAITLALSIAAFSHSGGALAADATVTPTPAPTATNVVAQLGSGGTHLAFWNGLTGSDGSTMADLLAGFVKEHPEISVTMEEIPWGTLYPKLQTALVGGTPPDVVILHSAQIPQFASYGVLMDLGSWYKDKGGFFPGDDISKITRDGMDYKGVTYGIPLDNHGRGLWLSKNAFKKAGVDPNMKEPTNYADWVALFQKLTLDKNGKNAADPAFDPKNVVQWGFTVGEWPRVNFMAGLIQNGGNWVSADGKTITINSDAGVAALQQYIDLVYKYHVSPPEAGFDTWGGFAAGAVAILPTGTWFRNQAHLDTDIDSFVWPTVQFGPKQATYMGIHTFMVPATETGAQLAAVKTLVQWVSEHQIGWAASGQVPARLSVQAALDPTNYPSNIIIGKTMAAYGTLDWSTPAILEMFDAIDPELSAALNNQKTAKQALDDAAKRMQSALDRAGS